MSGNKFFSRYFSSSIALHVVVAALLLCSFPSRPVSPTATNEKIINGVTLDQAQVDKEISAIKAREQAIKDQDKALQNKNSELEKAIQAQQKKLAQVQQEITNQQQAQLELKKKQQIEEKQHKLAEKKKAEAEQKIVEQEKQRRLTSAKKLAEQKTAEDEKQRAIDEKKKADAQKAAQAKRQAESDAARAQQIQSTVKHHTQLIVKAISQNWLIPANVTPDMLCRLLIDLDSQGVVKNVQIIQSSHNPALDQSAVAAVYKASPLPVPSDVEALDTFRHFSLTVTPKDIQNV